MSDRQADVERMSEAIASIYEARARYLSEVRSLSRDLLSTAATVGAELLGELIAPPPERTSWFSAWGRRERAPSSADAPSSAYAPSSADAPSSSIQVTPTMALEVPSGGGTASGAFVVENTLAEPVAAKLQWTEFVAPDVLALRPALNFNPSELRLEPGQQAVVEVTTSTTDVLEPGVRYRGEIFVAELPGTRLRVDLSRRAAPGIVSSTSSQAGSIIGPADATSPAEGEG